MNWKHCIQPFNETFKFPFCLFAHMPKSRKVQRFRVPLHALPKKSISPPNAIEKERIGKVAAKFVVENGFIGALVHHRTALARELRAKTITGKLAHQMARYELRVLLVRKTNFFPGDQQRTHHLQRELTEYPFYELQFLKMQHLLEQGKKPSKKSVMNLIEKLEQLKKEYDLMHPKIPSALVPSLLRVIMPSVKSPQDPAFKKMLMDQLAHGVRHADSLFFKHLSLGGRKNFLHVVEADNYIRKSVIPTYLPIA